MDKARSSKKATKQIEEIENKVKQMEIDKLKNEVKALRLEEEKIDKKFKKILKRRATEQEEKLEKFYNEQIILLNTIVTPERSDSCCTIS